MWIERSFALFTYMVYTGDGFMKNIHGKNGVDCAQSLDVDYLCMRLAWAQPDIHRVDGTLKAHKDYPVPTSIIVAEDPCIRQYSNI